MMSIGEQNLVMQLPNPTMKQPIVSDQSLSKTHVSPTSHNFRSKSVGRNRKKNTPSNAWQCDLNDQNSDSPYYKGLLDQSLAIDVDAISSYPSPHIPTTHDQNSNSPYYKGLTDHSLVIGSWTSHSHSHNHSLPLPPTNSLYTPSPYSRGLLANYTLVIHSPPTFSNYHTTSIKTRAQFIHKLSPPHISPSLTNIIIKTDATLKDHLMVDSSGVDFLAEQGQVGSALKLISDKIALEEEDVELMTTGVDEEKSLRESGSVVNQVEDKAEKVALEEITDVELEIEEKPLRERILEQASELDEKISEVITQMEEKPLRERVSETSNVVEMNVLKDGELKDYKKEKTLSVSEQTLIQTLVTSESRYKKEGTEDVYEYTWATKYQPKTLQEFICNEDIALQLKEMVKEGCGCSHFIFEGPPSVGKRSMIRAMLREVFGEERVQVTEEFKNFKLKGEMVSNVQVRLKKSAHHVEVNLSETKGYEKHVIVDLFKETYGQVLSDSEPCCPENCKAIVLYEAEKLSIESLLYIKWLLEKYKGCNKVFFCCSDESKLQPVKPLCITLRLSSPSTQELVQILEYIGKEEGIKLSRELVVKIISMSKNNLRQAIRSLEATCRNKDALEEDDLILTGWEEDILNIAQKIIHEQNPRQLYVIRRKLQSLMIHDVPPHFVYKFLIAELTNLVHESLRPGVAKLDKEFNRASEMKFESIKFGHAQNKRVESDEKNPLTYLKVEEFIAKFMSWYKNSCEKGNITTCNTLR